ncbi:MAG: class I SAM-dependent methyltransferase [Phycisphaerales bacterium]|nr:class I SAM-dependent methyltransferase [Phycisphaerales bacterium]
MSGPDEGRRGVRRRAMAWMYDRMMRSYERFMAERKAALLSDLEGQVVEIGVGTGANLRYLNRERVEWIGVEPSLPMRRRAEAERQRRGVRGCVAHGTAEDTGLDDACADVVVSTLVLCSVEDVPGALREAQRILRPGGRMVFIEHVAAPPGTWLRRVQNGAAPFWRWFADGCRCNALTLPHLEAAGFASLEMESFRAPAGLCSPHVQGVAVVPGANLGAAG